MQKLEVVQPKAVSASREFQLKIILESSLVLCPTTHLSLYCIDTFLKQYLGVLSCADRSKMVSSSSIGGLKYQLLKIRDSQITIGCLRY